MSRAGMFTIVGGVVVGILGAGYLAVQFYLSAPLLTEDDVAQMRADVVAQNEGAFAQPDVLPRVDTGRNELRNVYFGELHTHSRLSFDAYLFGNRLSVDQSYRFAKGEPMPSPTGEIMQLTRPLDFAAITDHAEGFGMMEACGDPARNDATADLCDSMEQPSTQFFLQLRRDGTKRPPVSGFADAVQDPEKQRDYVEATWAHIVSMAEQHNAPGKFTAFAAYEYSPPLEGTGKIHRNVIFRNSDVPPRAISAFDALSEFDLWEQLEAGCKAGCEFLTIPHNPNKTWGLAFAGRTIDGDVYSEADWATRGRLEPLVEIFQIKGNSECSLGVGTTDEECGIEQFLPRCESADDIECIQPTSMVRDGLKKGLQLDEELGFNPLTVGLIGSTDTHNSNPGDAEEWDFRGANGIFAGSATSRLTPTTGGRNSLKRNPGGLAAIWAEENTRDSLFDAMQRKEVYATSGTRMKLRFFGGLAFPDDFDAGAEPVAVAYATGVPMGGRLEGTEGAKPTFLVQALKDPIDASLDKVQIVKGWTQDGESFEQVVDVICSDGRQPDPETQLCPQTSARVDLSDCSIDEGVGAAALSTLWTDESFVDGQKAFYYARVLQNPTCRWSTFDSLRVGIAPPGDVSPTTTELAWSSPIWVN
ncbi:MAG: DUF3604 domain-containing protein [Candidatus Phaeomarinobacter sp.]